MKTLGEVLTLAKDHLTQRKLSRARRLAEELLSWALELPRLELYLQYDRPLIEEEMERCRQGLRRLAMGEPPEYLKGEIAFYQCQIRVTPEVLIPRPETEILLDKVCRSIAPEGIAWDLCCGSGCLGIGLKKALPQLAVVLSDISPAALQVARANAAANGVEVEFLEGDLLAPFQGRKADVVLCNPPYVSAGEYEDLDPSVKQFEPKLALVGGAKGWEFYERLARELPSLLNAGAKVFLEMGSTQGSIVKEIFHSPCWKSGELEKDYAGHDRFFSLEFE